MIKKYNKLIRDRIPEIIESKGNSCTTAIMDDEEYRNKLSEKLVEEAKEFLESRSEEEMADVLEVFLALSRAYDFQHIEELRVKKREERGGFDNKLLLLETVVNE